MGDPVARAGRVARRGERSGERHAAPDHESTPDPRPVYPGGASPRLRQILGRIILKLVATLMTAWVGFSDAFDMCRAEAPPPHIETGLAPPVR